MKLWGLLLVALLAVACGRVSKEEARTLVERYNQVVSEAYRRGDIRLIDSVVAPDCPAGKKLTGLIGVRVDMGLILDAHLEELQVTSVAPTGAELYVHTRERWSYRDRKLDTGEQVGEASVDNYELRYSFKKLAGSWMVTETLFTAPPQVGRKVTPWRMDAKEAHAMAAPEPGKGGKP